MSNLNRWVSRRELLRIICLSAPVILSGCSEMSDKEKRLTERRTRLMKRTSPKRQKLLKKVRQGYEGYPPPQQKAQPRK